MSEYKLTASNLYLSINYVFISDFGHEVYIQSILS